MLLGAVKETFPGIGLALHAHGLVQENRHRPRSRARARHHEASHEQEQQGEHRQSEKKLEEVARHRGERVGDVLPIEKRQRRERLGLETLALNQVDDDRDSQPDQPQEHPGIKHQRLLRTRRRMK